MSYESIGRAIGSLVDQKQKAYGDSFGKSGEVMRILYPGGIPPEKVDDALTVVRILDKLFRIATDRDALGEDPWGDIAGYAVLSIARVRKKKGDEGRTVLDALPRPGLCGTAFTIGGDKDLGETTCNLPGGHNGPCARRVLRDDLRPDGTRIGTDEGRASTRPPDLSKNDEKVDTSAGVAWSCPVCPVTLRAETDAAIEVLVSHHRTEHDEGWRHPKTDDRKRGQILACEKPFTVGEDGEQAYCRLVRGHSGYCTVDCERLVVQAACGFQSEFGPCVRAIHHEGPHGNVSGRVLGI